MKITKFMNKLKKRLDLSDCDRIEPIINMNLEVQSFNIFRLDPKNFSENASVSNVDGSTYLTEDIYIDDVIISMFSKDL